MGVSRGHERPFVRDLKFSRLVFREEWWWSVRLVYVFREEWWWSALVDGIRRETRPWFRPSNSFIASSRRKTSVQNRYTTLSTSRIATFEVQGNPSLK